VRRNASAAVVVMALVAMGWWMWPRPSAVIVIERGGLAWVERMTGRVPLPETLHVAAAGRGTTLRVVNQDTVRHELALFGANAGETREYTIAYPGTYAGVCTTHPKTKRLVYVVE